MPSRIRDVLFYLQVVLIGVVLTAGLNIHGKPLLDQYNARRTLQSHVESDIGYDAPELESDVNMGDTIKHVLGTDANMGDTMENELESEANMADTMELEMESEANMADTMERVRDADEDVMAVQGDQYEQSYDPSDLEDVDVGLGDIVSEGKMGEIMDMEDNWDSDEDMQDDNAQKSRGSSRKRQRRTRKKRRSKL